MILDKVFNKGSWDNATAAPSPVIAGDIYAWNGGASVLNSTSWGSINGEAIENSARVTYTSDSDWISSLHQMVVLTISLVVRLSL